MEGNEKSTMKVLKWAGIIALVAVPVVLFLKKRKAQETQEPSDDDTNIFASELEA